MIDVKHLRKCPFCKSNYRLTYSQKEASFMGMEFTQYRVACLGCHIEGPAGSSLHHAGRFWGVKKKYRKIYQ